MANNTSIWVTARRIAKLDEMAKEIGEKTGLTADDRKRASEALRASLVEAAKHLYEAACPADAFAAEMRQACKVVKTKADLLQSQVEEFCGQRSRLRPTFTVIHTEDQDGNTAVFRLTKGHVEVLAAGVNMEPAEPVRRIFMDEFDANWGKPVAAPGIAESLSADQQAKRAEEMRAFRARSLFTQCQAAETRGFEKARSLAIRITENTKNHFCGRFSTVIDDALTCSMQAIADMKMEG